jgi:hypothetical protein
MDDGQFELHLKIGKKQNTKKKNQEQKTEP